MANLLTRDAILGASDLTTEDVNVPEWGGPVRVRSLTAAQRDKFEADSMVGNGKNRDLNMVNIRARLVSLTIVGEDNQPIFGAADVKALGDKSGRALDRVFEVASRLSGIGESDIEELAGNSVAGQSASLPSD